MISIANLRCSCGSDDIALIDPGEIEERTLFLLKRGRPVTARCLACWVATPAKEVVR